MGSSILHMFGKSIALPERTVLGALARLACHEQTDSEFLPRKIRQLTISSLFQMRRHHDSMPETGCCLVSRGIARRHNRCRTAEDRFAGAGIQGSGSNRWQDLLARQYEG